LSTTVLMSEKSDCSNNGKSNWALAKRVFKISLDRYLASKH
jgi:hypothetical protein